MNTRQMLTGLGAFAGGVAALVAAAVLGDAYAQRRAETAPAKPDVPESDASVEPKLVEAPQVAEQRDDRPAPVKSAAPFPTAESSPEHVPTDLMADADPGSSRAPDAFRPDPTAPVPDSMRDSLRPATGPAKAFAANEGETVTEALNPG